MLFDLEDAVAVDSKDAARRNVADALRAGGFGPADAAVRVNAPATRWFAADVEAAIGAGARLLMLPKAASADGVARAAERVGAAEGSVGLLLLVESPEGIADALAIGRASSRSRALCFGHADFSLEMGISGADPAAGVVLHARCALAIAARASGLLAIDGVHVDVRDEAAFRRDAELGRSLGFDGKLCIHPRQVAIANEVYTPGADEISRARAVLEAAAAASAEGRGVFTLDGKMIDAPFVAAARRVLERARRAGGGSG